MTDQAANRNPLPLSSAQLLAQQLFANVCRVLGFELTIWQCGETPTRILGDHESYPDGDFKSVTKLASHLYVMDVTSAEIEWRCVVNVASSRLRPKLLIPALMDSVAEMVAALLQPSSTDKPDSDVKDLQLISHTLLVSKNMQGLINLVAQFIKTSLGLDAVYLRLEPSDRDPIATCVGEHCQSLSEWIADDQVQGLIGRMRSMRERGLSVEIANGFAPLIHLSYVADGPREIGFFALAANSGSRFSAEIEESLSSEIAAIYDKARLEDKREARVMSLSSELTHERESNRALTQDLKLIKSQWAESKNVMERYQRLFRLFDALRTVPCDEHYLDKFLEFVRNLTAGNTATICFSEIQGMNLVYVQKDKRLGSLAFSELDGGLYHDLLFSGEPLYWDGCGVRSFELPSGHPRVRNCIAVPFDWGELRGVVLAANLSDVTQGKGLMDSLQKVIAMSQTDVRLAYLSRTSELD